MSLYVIQFMKFRALRTPLTSRLTLAPCYLNYLFIFITCNNLQYSTRRLIECRMISFSRSRLFGSMWIGSLRSAQLCTLAICWSRLIFSFFFFFGFAQHYLRVLGKQINKNATTIIHLHESQQQENKYQSVHHFVLNFARCWQAKESKTKKRLSIHLSAQAHLLHSDSHNNNSNTKENNSCNELN